jgi:RecA-family ATPase
MATSMVLPPQCTGLKSLTALLSNPVSKVPSYVGNGVLPMGGSLLFGGPAGLGKSLVISNFIYDCAAGWPVFGLGPITLPDGTVNERLNVQKPLKILYIENEVGEMGLQVRFDKIHQAKQSPLALQNISVLSKGNLLLAIPKGQDSPNWFYQVQDWMAVLDYVKPNIIVGDPFATLHLCDENSNQEMTTITGNAQEILKHYKQQSGIDASWCIVHHFRKRQKDEPTDMALFRGAGRLTDWADTRLLMEPKIAKGQDGVYHHFRHLTFSVVRQGPSADDIWAWIDPKSLVVIPGHSSASTGFPLG